MSGETLQQTTSSEQVSEAQDVVKALEIALNIAKSNNLTYEQALGVCAKLLQPVSPNSF
jgi:hypothetical protein